MRYRVRRQRGENSAGSANKFENKKTNNALRDKTCPGVDVARFFEKESPVEQGFPGREAEMGRTRAKTRCSCQFKVSANRKQD